MSNAPGFLTNHELDLFLGGGEAGQRQRQRLRRDRLLPAPVNLGKVRHANIAVFPRFALAGLQRDVGRIPRATDTMQALAAAALDAGAFSRVRAAVLDAARALGDWSFEALVAGVVERAEDALREWEERVALAERELGERFGISFATELGVIERLEDDVCVVSLDAGGTERVPSFRVAAAREQGHAVALERVSVLARELGYVMPLEITDSAAERELATWFAKMAAPDKTAAGVELEASHDEPLPYRRSRPRRSLWHGASTMTRVPAAG